MLLVPATALTQPDLFVWIMPYVSPLLGLIMLGMGLTSQPVDFHRLMERSRDVAIGALTQRLVMPTTAYTLTVVLPLPSELAIGVILVGTTPGGTASNVMTYPDKGDVALSVAIMTVTTPAASSVIPARVVALADEQFQVGFVDLFLNIVQIVFIPAVLGFALRVILGRNAPGVAEVGLDVFPLVSVLSIVAIAAVAVGLNVDIIFGAGAAAIGVVVLHNVIGLGAGYDTGRLVGMSTDRVRATMLEISLQDNGLAAAFVLPPFLPAAALPPALFSVWHSTTGPLLASCSVQTTSGSAGDAPADD